MGLTNKRIMEKGLLKQNGVHLKAHEYCTVKFLLEKGYDVELIPPSTIKGLRMPDIMLLGIPWEMKSPEGNGKRTIQNTMQNASHQSTNLLIDLRRCKLQEAVSVKGVTHHFRLSKRIRRVLIITKDEKILDLNKG